MKNKLLNLIVMLFVVSSCHDDNQTYGSTFDEIKDDIIDVADTVTLTEQCIKDAELTESMKKNADQYRTATHQKGNERNGIYVYSSTVNKYKDFPIKLASRIAVLGFKDVYLSPGKSMIINHDKWLSSFISTLHGFQIRVHAIRIADNNLYVNNNISSEVSLINTYNNSVEAAARFSGIAADLEPHTCKGAMKPNALQYEWDSDTNYGIGGNNDNLLRITLEILKQAKDNMLDNMQLNEAISYNFQTKVNENLLSYGTVPQFLEYCNWVIVMSYLNNKESIWTKSEPSLIAAEIHKDKKKTVSICVKTSINDITSSQSLQNKGWNYLLETAKYILDKGNSYISFRGFDIFNYEGLENMWENAE